MSSAVQTSRRENSYQKSSPSDEGSAIAMSKDANKTTVTNNTNHYSFTRQHFNRTQRQTICCNCGEAGHYSMACQKPQRRIRCDHCKRFGHSEADCLDKVPDENIMKINKHKQPTDIYKTTLINNISF